MVCFDTYSVQCIIVIIIMMHNYYIMVQVCGNINIPHRTNDYTDKLCDSFLYPNDADGRPKRFRFFL